MPQRIGDLGLAALVLAALLLVLTGIDGRVPSQLTHAVTVTASADWHEAGPLGAVMLTIGADPTMRNGLIVAMVVSATLLVFLMVKMK